jgi:hypothetical protein
MRIFVRRLLQIGSSLALLALGHVVFIEATAQANVMDDLAVFALGVAGISVNEKAAQKVHAGFEDSTGLNFPRTLQLAGAADQDIAKLPTLYFANRELLRRIEEEIGTSSTLSDETLIYCANVLEQNHIRITGIQWNRTARLILANLMMMQNHGMSLRQDQRRILAVLEDLLRRKSGAYAVDGARVCSSSSDVDLFHI